MMYDHSLYTLQEVASYLNADIKMLRSVAHFLGMKDRIPNIHTYLFTHHEVKELEKLHNSMHVVNFETHTT